jgi:ABC-2 type transport system ATP-binding protein
MAKIFGHDIVHETVAARQSMGIVSETSNVYTDLTGWQNMMLAAQLYRVGRSERDRKATRSSSLARTRLRSSTA